MTSKKLDDFNWEKYEEWDGVSLKVNKKVKVEDSKTKVYSHEPYAQKIFELYNNSSSKFIRKDLEKGDIVPIKEISSLNSDGKMTIEIMGGLTIDVDLSREKRFIQLFGFNTIDEFASALIVKEKRESFIEQGLYAYVIESSPSVKISLWQGYIKKIREEFTEQISSPSKAYVAKIYQANKGGFFVEVQGVDAFMPGSLAAPNKIIDFQSYVGKEVIVMIENYLKDMNSFIVSHKKYIEHILPKKIEELSLEELYKGTVTGASKYGVFVEFGDIFTGLLHKSKMKPETYQRFQARGFNPGDDIEFYLGEITKDNRIILTEESPAERKERIQIFLKEYENKPILAEVASVMSFGIIVTCGDLSGVVPNKEFRKAHTSSKNFIKGEGMKLKLLEVREDDKLVFTFWMDEKEEGA